MSIVSNFLTASDADIDDLLEEPVGIVAFLDPAVNQRCVCDGVMDLDQAWHGIHFLLCDDSWKGTPPLNFIICGGTTIGNVDVGYGPARAYRSDEVAEIAQAIEPITGGQLREKFDPRTFFENDISPEIWDDPIEDCVDTYLLIYFARLKDFVLDARDDGKGMIVFAN